jgi:hypothetical protein
MAGYCQDICSEIIQHLTPPTHSSIKLSLDRFPKLQGGVDDKDDVSMTVDDKQVIVRRRDACALQLGDPVLFGVRPALSDCHKVGWSVLRWRLSLGLIEC